MVLQDNIAHEVIGNNGIKAFGEPIQQQVQFGRKEFNEELKQIGRGTSQKKQKKIHQ